ncbi:MAG TPA: tetratricopeptide repeat protein [Rhodocyclaceae bacterium]|nr:tetratricopeptide repeat protein [Rhodocyclaceae bacterium]
MKSIPFLAKTATFTIAATLASQALAMSADELAATRSSAEHGNAAAQMLLGVAYLDGDAGLPVDPKEGARWLEQAALQGNTYAADRLGDLHAHGTGVEKNTKLSADWHEWAARGYDAGSASASIWQMLEHAGYTQDRMLSEQALRKLAGDGDAEAQFRLAENYEHGHGGEPRDIQAAIHWLQLAAEQNHAEAMASLARIYGQGAPNVAIDARAADYWSERARSAAR